MATVSTNEFFDYDQPARPSSQGRISPDLSAAAGPPDAKASIAQWQSVSLVN